MVHDGFAGNEAGLTAAPRATSEQVVFWIDSAPNGTDSSKSQHQCGCSSVVEHLLAKERVESSNLFIRLHGSHIFQPIRD